MFSRKIKKIMDNVNIYNIIFFLFNEKAYKRGF